MTNLSHIEKYGDLIFWVTMPSIVGASFRYESLDSENIDDEKVLFHLKEVFGKISENVVLRFHTKTFKDFNPEEDHARVEATQKVGQVKHYSILSIETFRFTGVRKYLLPFSLKRSGDISDQVELIKKTFYELNLNSIGIKLTPLTESETINLFDVPNEVLKYRDFLSFKTSVFGAVRLKAMKSVALDVELMAELRAELPKPYEISVTMRKIDIVKSEMSLRNKVKELETMNSENLAKKRTDVEGSIDDVVFGGESQFNVEYIVSIERSDETTLRRDLLLLENTLSRIGKTYIESEGTFPTWTSMQEGSYQRIKFELQSTGAALLIPIFSYGDAKSRALTDRSILKLHRRGGELDAIDIFLKTVDRDNCGNTLISGAKGSGKSLLLALMTQSILNDEENMIYKIDVGSSYVRECQKYGGIRYNVSLDNPIGINPLELIRKTHHSQEVCQIIYGFIEVLLLEHNEQLLGIGLKSEITDAIIKYSLMRPTNPSLNDFYEKMTSFPRREYLKRWVKGGIYENVFKESMVDLPPNRYHYFDFESIAKAQDNDLIRGITAALIVKYNSEIYFNGKTGKRVFLICDETKFFLNRCSAFFHLTVSNARKFGDSVILVNQESMGFYTVDETGKLSDSIYRNASHIFMYNVDGDEKDFKARNKNLSARDYEKIKTLKSHKPYYGEVFYKSNLESKVFRIIPTANEFWTFTTDRDDNKKIFDLSKEFKLSEIEVIECLIKQKDHNQVTAT